VVVCALLVSAFEVFVGLILLAFRHVLVGERNMINDECFE
jgi:hypothetical protein